MWFGGSEFDIFSFTGLIDRHSVDAKFYLLPEVKNVNVLPRLNLYIFYSHKSSTITITILRDFRIVTCLLCWSFSPVVCVNLFEIVRRCGLPLVYLMR